jgi:hypothetical protein
VIATASQLPHVDGEIAPVNITVERVERVERSGSVNAVASVEVVIGGIAFMHVSLCHRGGEWSAEMPSITLDGKRVAAIVLPEELAAAVGREALEAWIGPAERRQSA